MEDGRKTMEKKRATRHRCNDDRAFLSLSRDIQRIAEIERAEHLAGIIIALAFGLCMFVGLMA